MIICVGLGNPGKEYQKTRHNIGFRVVEAVAARVLAHGVVQGISQEMAQGAVAKSPAVPPSPVVARKFAQKFTEQKKLFARVARFPLTLSLAPRLTPQLTPQLVSQQPPQHTPQLTPKLTSQFTAQQQLLCVQPLTFMNDSGKAVAAVLKYHPTDDISQLSQFSQLYVCHDDLDLQLGNYKIQWGKGPKVHNGLASLYEHLGTKEFWHVRIGVDNRGGARTVSGREYVLRPFSPEEEKVIQEVTEKVVKELLKIFAHVPSGNRRLS